MTTELDAPITAVTVYTDRARVTRSNQIELSAGETVLILSGLPSKMDKDSVRVSGKGAGIISCKKRLKSLCKTSIHCLITVT